MFYCKQLKFIKKQVWIDNITLWVLENFRDKMAKKSYYVLIKMGGFFSRELIKMYY